MVTRVDPKTFSLKQYIKKDIEKATKLARERWAKEASEEVKKEIIKSIEEGMSPVKGVGRYEPYSESYKEAINKGRYSAYNKKTNPVNLKLSGKLHKSIRTRITKTGFSIWFTDRKFTYHNDLGAGKSRVIRPILPTGAGERFRSKIEKVITDIIIKHFYKEKK